MRIQNGLLSPGAQWVEMYREFGRDRARLRAPQLGELHAGFEITLPVLVLRHCRESLGQGIRFDADRVGPHERSGERGRERREIGRSRPRR